MRSCPCVRWLLPSISAVALASLLLLPGCGPGTAEVDQATVTVQEPGEAILDEVAPANSAEEAP